MSAACRTGSGFSLIELIVAVAVLAVISALAWTGLAVVGDTRTRLAEAQAEFAAVQRSVDFLARDLALAVDRPVRVGAGAREAALAGDTRKVALTRTTAASELVFASSALERVSWFLDGKALTRARYAVLDRPDERSLATRKLAPQVEEFRLRYMDARGRWSERWPPRPPAEGAATALPRAVEFRMDFAGFGEIRRVVELAAAAPLPASGPGSGP